MKTVVVTLEALDWRRRQALAIPRKEMQPRLDVPAEQREIETFARLLERPRVERDHHGDVCVAAVSFEPDERSVLRR